jgi:hypothetical protein
MMKRFSLICLVVLLAVATLFKCGTFPNDNPHDSIFEGNYCASIDWTGFRDTVDIFSTRQVLFSSCTDRFDSILCESASAIKPMSDSILTASYLAGLTNQNDTLSLYFSQVYTGSVQLCGKRPNEQLVCSEGRQITIVNPYAITAPQAAGVNESCKVHIEHATRGRFVPTFDSILVEWQWEGGDTATLGIDKDFTFATGQSLGIKTLKARLMDRAGNSVNCGEKIINITGARPVITITPNNDTLTLGDTLTLQASITDTDDDSVRILILLRTGPSTQDTLLADKWVRLTGGIYTIKTNYPIKYKDIVHIEAIAIDNDNLQSTPAAFYRNVRWIAPRPRLTPKNTVVPAGKSQTFRAYDSTHTTTQYFFKSRRKQIEQFSTADTFVINYAVVDTDTIIVIGQDAYGYQGPPDTSVIRAQSFTYSLQLSEPSDSLIGHWIKIKGIASGSDGALSLNRLTFRWSYGTPDSSRVSNDSLYVKYLRDTLSTVRCSVLVDGYSDTTNTATKLVRAKLHKPIAHFYRTQWTANINSTTRCTVHVADANSTGSISKIFWKLGNEATDSGNIADSIWTRTFTAPGEQRLKVWCRDNDGYLSDMDSTRLVIVSTAPVITGIQWNTPLYRHLPGYFSADTVRSSSGGTIDTFYWDFDGDTSTRWDTITRTPNVTKTFNTAGSKTILVKCRDSYLAYSTVVDSVVTVLQGEPNLSSIAFDTSTTNVFIKDARRFIVHAGDPNGYIRYLYFDIDGVRKATHSWLTTQKDTVDSFFNWTFAAGDSGLRQIRIITQDDDSLRDTVSMANLNVRVGRPKLWADSGDTIWIKVDNGIANPYYYNINHFDTNGTISKYYWSSSQWTSLADTNSGTNTVVDSTTYIFTEGFLHTGLARYIYAKDDDGIFGGGRFLVYGDSAPQALDVYTAGISGGNVTFYWAGKDVKDLNQTEYKIVMKRNTDPTDNDSILVDFKAGAQYTNSDLPAYDFKTTIPITPPDGLHGQYKYRIIARDSRLSITRSDIDNFPY